MSDRRAPLPPRDHDYPPSRSSNGNYDRRAPLPSSYPPPPGDYRRQPHQSPPSSYPPPLPPASYDRAPPPSSRRRDPYEQPPSRVRGASPDPFDGRVKRRRSHSPPRRGGPPGEFYGEPHPRDYPPRDPYRQPPPPGYRDDYPPPLPPSGRPLPPPSSHHPHAHHRPPPPSGPPRGDPRYDMHPSAMIPPPHPAYGYERAGGFDSIPPSSASAASREIEAPHHLSYKVTHRYFSDWFRQSNTSTPSLLDSNSDALEVAWKKYLAEHIRKDLRPKFEEMKSMKWFEERYGVGEELEKGRKERVEVGRRGRKEDWIELAKNGEWEGLSFAFDEEAVASSSKPDSNGDTSMNGTDGDDEKKTKKPRASLGDGLMVLTPETVSIPSRPNRIVIEAILPSVGYSDLNAVFSPLEGFVRLSIGDGQSDSNWIRTGWATFDTEENAIKAVASLNDVTIGEYKLSLSRQETPIESKIRSAPAHMSTRERIAKDVETVGKILEYLEGDEEGGEKGTELIKSMKEGWENEAKEKEGDGDAEKVNAEIVRKTLDLSLHYLRYAFHICYYCCIRCESAEHLESVCVRHVRRVGPPSPNELSYVVSLDEKLPLLGDHDQLDLRDFGAELKEEVLFSLCQPHIKNEEEGKFRCKECNKLFSARKFVEKHILTKHGQFVGDALDRIAYFNNYILDPSRQPLAEFQRMNFLPSLLPSNVPSLAERIGGRRNTISDKRSAGRRGGGLVVDMNGPAAEKPPPPKGASLDPRSARVPSSYADLDGAPTGGVDVIELPY